MTVETSTERHYNDWGFPRPQRLRLAAVWGVCQASAALQRLRGNTCSDGFGILMYHRVADEVPGVESPTMNVTPSQLRTQLTGLLDRGFECWSLRDLLAAHHAGEPIPPGAFAITFDDGFENNYLNAWPILRELNTPATIFVATKYLDTDRPFPFDDWRPAGTSRVPRSSWHPLSTRQVDELLEEGTLDIGAHTHSHEKFLGRPDDFRRDMTTCLDVLRRKFGIERPTFAFPYGYKSPELADVLRELGVACSLSTHARRVAPGDDPFEWGRFWADPHDSATMLAGKMCWYEKVLGCGKPALSALIRWERATNRGGTQRLENGAFGEFSHAEGSATR